jgi:hypothetical protein
MKTEKQLKYLKILQEQLNKKTITKKFYKKEIKSFRNIYNKPPLLKFSMAV